MGVMSVIAKIIVGTFLLAMAFFVAFVILLGVDKFINFVL